MIIGPIIRRLKWQSMPLIQQATNPLDGSRRHERPVSRHQEWTPTIMKGVGAHAPANKETFPESIRSQLRIDQDPLSIKANHSEILSLDNALAIKAPFTGKEITWEPRITIRSARITVKHSGIYGKITLDHHQPV